LKCAASRTGTSDGFLGLSDRLKHWERQFRSNCRGHPWPLETEGSLTLSRRRPPLVPIANLRRFRPLCSARIQCDRLRTRESGSEGNQPPVMQLVAVGTRDAALPAPGFLSTHDAQGFGALVIPHHSSPTVDPGCRPQACVWAAMIVVHDPLGQHAEDAVH
jgi:hypothetical protein